VQRPRGGDGHRRFAFAPLLPIMLAEGAVGFDGASRLANANYLGWLFVAVLCALHPPVARQVGFGGSIHAAKLVRSGLVATALLTLSMALPPDPGLQVGAALCRKGGRAPRAR
jgi:hypothetical protein